MLIDLEDSVHLREIETDRPPEIPIIAVLDASDDAGPAAKGTHGDALIARPIEDGDDFGFTPRKGHPIGGRWILSVEASIKIAIRLAVRVPDARFIVRADEIRERLGNVDARFTEADRLDARG